MPDHYLSPWGRKIPLIAPVPMRDTDRPATPVRQETATPAQPTPPGMVRAHVGVVPGEGWTYVPASTFEHQESAMPARGRTVVTETTHRPITTEENHR